MKKVIIIILFSCFSIGLFAMIFSGFVKDEKGNAISGVSVQSDKVITWTDSLGYFTIKGVQASEYLIFKKIDYETRGVLFKQGVNQEILLKRKAILFNSIHVLGKEDDRLTILESSQKIKKEDLSNKKDQTVADWVQGNSGIEIKGNVLSGESKTIVLSGHSPKHTIVMLDGLVLNPSGMEMDLSTIPSDRIESVEIIKNNASVESGSGAIAGIISIKSKKSDQSKGSFSSFFGSFGLIHQKADLSFKNNHSQIGVNYTFLTTDNDFEYTDRNTGLTEKRKENKKRYQVFGVNYQREVFKGILDINSNIRLFNNQLPGPYNYSNLYEGCTLSGNNSRSYLTYDKKGKERGYSFHGYYFKDDTSYENLKASIPFYKSDSDHHQVIHGIKSNIYHPFLIFNFTEGAEYKNEKYSYQDQLNLSQNIAPVSREFYSAYTQVNQETKGSSYIDLKHSLTFRLDYNQKFNTNQSYRFEETINLNTYIPTKIQMNYGTSYMLPSFYDLYWKGDSQTVGNPNLKPERSKGYRISTEIGDNPKISQAYWKNTTKDQIYWDRSLHGWKPFNITTAEIVNYESVFNWEFIHKQKFSCNYTRTIARNKSRKPDNSESDLYNKYLIYTPSWTLNASLDLEYKAFHQTIEYKATGEQWTTKDQLINPLSQFEIWNTHSSYHKSIKAIDLSLIFSIMNVFNKSYEVYIYNPEPGINWQTQFKITYKI